MSKEAIEHYEAALKEAFPRGATGDVFHHWNEARKALEAAEKQEPVAVVSGYYGGQCVVLPTNPARLFNSDTAFYTTPPAAPVQEPVANASAWFALVMNAAAELEDASHCLRDEDAKRTAISGAKHYRDAAKALYTTPPAAQWQWVGLSDEELHKLWRESPFRGSGGQMDWFTEGARVAEAKLRSKNGGQA